MTTLILVLFLGATYGGTVRPAQFTFESPEACRTFYRHVQKFTVDHQVVQACPPAPPEEVPEPAPVAPTPES